MEKAVFMFFWNVSCSRNERNSIPFILPLVNERNTVYSEEAKLHSFGKFFRVMEIRRIAFF